MITVDASVLIAHLDPHDAHHRAATTVLQSALGDTLLTHPLNLAEVLVGGVRVGRGEEMLADLQAIGVQVAHPDAGAPLRLATLRATTGLKLPDCCALDTALAVRAPLATFDDRLAEHASRRHVLLPRPGRSAGRGTKPQ